MRLAVVVMAVGCGGGSSPPTVFDPAAVWGGNLVAHDGRVYTTTFNESCGSVDDSDHAVWSFPIAGGDPSVVFCGGSHQLFGFGMAVGGGRVFWSGDGDGASAIWSAPIEGGERALVAELSSAPESGVATDDQFVYAAGEFEIVRAPLAGGDAEVIFQRSIGAPIGWFDIVGDQIVAIIASISHASDVLAMATDGSASTPLDTLPDLQNGQFCFDDEALFVVRSDDVVRIPRDGSASTVFATQLAGPKGCAVLDGEVYTSLGGLDNSTTKQIVRLRPGGIDVLAEVDSTIVFMLVIDGRVLHYAGLGAFGRIDL